MSTSRPVLIVVADIEQGSKDFHLFMVQLIKQMEISESRINLLITSNADFTNRAGVL